MARSYRLSGPRSHDLPAGFVRDILSSLGYTSGTWLKVGPEAKVVYSVAVVTPADIRAALRGKGWSEHAIEGVIISRSSWFQDEPDHTDMVLSRRAYRRGCRTKIASGRVDDIDPYPHRHLKSWW